MAVATEWTGLALAALLLVSLSLAAAAPTGPGGAEAAAGASAPAGIAVHQRVLANGLKVLVQENHAAPLVCSFIWYRVGLRSEPRGAAGITHFLEHMAFKGTERFSGREMDRLVTMRGGYLNGFTSMDYTAYIETLPPEALDLAFEIESERMARCLLKPEDIESEKGVVISEFEGAENDPGFLLRKEVMAAQFPDQPYGRTVIGEKADLRHLTREQVLAYYREHYAPNNAVLVVVGDVQADEVFAKAERSFGPIPPSTLSSPTPNPGRGSSGERRVNLELPGRTSYLHLVYEVPPIAHPDHIALEVLQNILSGGRTSRLYRAFVDAGLASDANAWDYENPDPTVFAFEIALRPGRAHQEAEDALEALLDDLRRNPVSERELTKAKNQTKAHFVYAADGVSKLAQQLGYYELLVGHDYLRTFPQRVDAVTPADIQRVVQQYFVRENRTVGWLTATGEVGADQAGGPPADLRRNADPRRPAGSVWCRQPEPAEAAGELQPALAPAGLGKLPPILQLTLDNGLQVVLQEEHAAPFVTIYGNVMAGPVFDPPGKAGLAAFAAEMLNHGTARRTWQEIQEALDFAAAQLSFGIGAQVATVGGQCLRADLGLLLEAAAEQLMSPAFPPEEIEKVRSLLLAGQERRDEDTFAVAEKELLARLYPEGHPLHHHSLGDKESVGSITRDDLLAFHERYYRPENTLLAIVGDFDPQQAAALIEQAFGQWPRRGEPARPDLRPVAPPAEPTVVRVPVPGKTQVDIALGFPGISRRHPRYYQADLMNYVLGRGGFMSRLNLAIREERGLAYYVWSVFRAYWGPGPWTLQMGVDAANAEQAIAAAVAEVKRIQQEPPAEEELGLWKDYVQGTVARQMETYAGIAQNLVLSAFYDLGLYFPFEYPSILRAITPEQVREAAAETLHPEGYLAVIAGPVEEAPQGR